jgi:hypothetical protein
MIPRREMDDRPWLEGLAVGLLALLVLLLMDAYVRDSPMPMGDELIYELMARNPFDPHTFPFAYRVGVPTLVHVLPFSHEHSFSALAWLFSAGCGTLAYVLLRRFRIGRPLAGGIGFAFALCPTLFVVSLRQGANVDPESVFAMLAGTIAIVDRRPLAFAAILGVGVLVRESTLFLIPFAYAVWADRLWDARALRQVLAASLPALVAYAVLRLAIPTVARDQVLGYDSLLGGRLDVLNAAAGDPQYPLRRVALAFGPLWLAAPFALRELRFAREGLVLIACCLVSMTFALDWGRIILLAAPVVLVAAGWALRNRPRLAAAAVASFLALNLGYAVYMEDFGGAQDGIIEAAPPPYEVR